MPEPSFKIRPEDIRSLSAFERDTLTHHKELGKIGRTRVLAVNGKARVVVLDAAACQRLADQIERAEAIAGIARGLKSFEAGRGEPACAALESALAKAKAKSSRRSSDRPGTGKSVLPPRAALA